MRINRVNNRSSIKKVKGEKTSKFSDILEDTNKEQAKIEINKMLEDIDKIGKKLISTRSVEDARQYKEKIKEYLNLIVKNIYILKKEAGPYNYGVHVRIEIINEKLDKLTKDLIENQQESINLANKISEIRGLLVDVYK